jgi:hypothetical protein
LTVVTEQQEADLSELISRVRGQLKLETAYVQQQASILEATYETSAQHEFEGLAGQCDALSQKGHAAANSRRVASRTGSTR